MGAMCAQFCSLSKTMVFNGVAVHDIDGIFVLRWETFCSTKPTQNVLHSNVRDYGFILITLN